jgi:predicted phosphodiesterase
MIRKLAVLVLFVEVCALSVGSFAQIVIAQISDTHIGEHRAPHAADNLRKTVDMVNQRYPDAVIVSGDIGENAQDWQEAQSILKHLKAPLYYAPGNHDVHTEDVEKYRRVFGKDYYRFTVKDIDFVVIDSQLLGNYENYEAKVAPPLPLGTQAQADEMLTWLKRQKTGRPLIGIQHVPAFSDGSFPDPKPYWVLSEPFRSREMEIMHELGIKHMLVGHWHNGRVFDRDGIIWHVAPATSWLPWGGQLGFALHRISPQGKVETDFVELPHAEP